MNFGEIVTLKDSSFEVLERRVCLLLQMRHQRWEVVRPIYAGFFGGFISGYRCKMRRLDIAEKSPAEAGAKAGLSLHERVGRIPDT